MDLRQQSFRCICRLLAVILPLQLTFQRLAFAESSHYGIITSEMIAAGSPSVEAVKISNFLARDDVRLKLESLGVNQAEALARVSHLSDQEVLLLSQQIDSLPAGGHHGFGTLVGALLFLFVVLLITDILGLTKVFPFTRSVR